jgi:hypothetical protein
MPRQPDNSKPLLLWELDTPGGPLWIVARTRAQAFRIASMDQGYPDPYTVVSTREADASEIEFAYANGWGEFYKRE